MIFKKKQDNIVQLLDVKNLPILILDESFNYTFKDNRTPRMIEIEERLRSYMKEQGNLNSEAEQLNKTKKIRLSKILNLSGEKESIEKNQKMGTNQELVEHINEKLTNIEKRLQQLPELIRITNEELFCEAIKVSYNNVAKLYSKIRKLEPEIEKLREKLKEKNDEKNAVDDEYKEKSIFLRKFIGQDGIDILDNEYDGNIK